ncbi:hypothetical protein [Pedobacter sp. NJ-S-72]
MYFANHARYIGHFELVVRMMSPQNILNKGFAIVKVNGSIVSNADTIIPGTELTISFASSEINTKVLSKIPRNGKEFEL